MKNPNVKTKRGKRLASTYSLRSTILGASFILVFGCSQKPEYSTQKVYVPGFETLNYKISENFSPIETSEENHSTLRINIEDYKRRGINASEIIKKTQFIKLETNEENLIGVIDRLFFHNDTIVIKDSNISKGVFQFNSNGSYIQKIGINGQGPGEYLSPNNFAFSNDSYFIHSEFQGKIFEFDHTGKYKTEYLIPFLFDDFVSSRNGFIFNTHNRVNGHIESISNYMLVYTSSKFEISSGGIYFDPDVYMNMRVGFESSLKHFEGYTYYNQPFDHFIYRVSDNFTKIEVFYEFDFGEKGINRNQLSDLIKKNSFDVRGQLMDQGFATIEDFEIGNNHILLTILYNRIPIKLIIDIENMSINGFVLIVDDIYSLGGYSPNFLIGNRIVSIYEANSLISRLQNMRIENYDEYEKIITTFPELDSIKLDDNFILRIDELK